MSRNLEQIYIAIAVTVLTVFFLVRTQNFIAKQTRVELPEEILLSSSLSSYLILSNITDQSIQTNIGNATYFLEGLLTLSKFMESETSPDENNPLNTALLRILLSLIQQFPKFDSDILLNNKSLIEAQPYLRKWYSSLVYKLEVQHAKEIISGEVKPWEFHNYTALIEFEMENVNNFIQTCHLDRKIMNVAVIGSGPMPSTTIALFKHLPENATIINFDISPEAIEMGKQVIKTMGFDTNKISFILSSALDIQTLQYFDLVYLAALVGSDNEEKKTIIQNLYDKMKPGAILLARSSEGLRRIIWQQICKDEFGPLHNFTVCHSKRKDVLVSTALGVK